MNLVFLDLEYNQVKGSKIAIMPFEIIEFACIVTDFQLNPQSEMSYYIKPRYQTKVDDRVKRITGIEDKDLKKGIDFNICMNRFKELCGDNFYIITWGSDDMKIIKQNCIVKKCNYDFLKNIVHINAQKSYQVINNLEDLSSLQKVKKFLDVPSSKEHRAYYDVLDLISICKNIGISNILTVKESIVDEEQKRKQLLERLIQSYEYNKNKCDYCKNEGCNEVLKEIKPYYNENIDKIKGLLLTKCSKCNCINLLRINDKHISRKKYFESNPNTKSIIEKYMKINK
ncbi:TPA: exonuclease domain-containing protein [Clostridium botulinum]|uniref:3'-5' exonuclease n=1 Tax=Clostridium botulinum TaxID=1491 RepID=UPI00046712BC|nr:3'-5' exonuclease [Clostridium botulinum]APR02461.1 exonuclease family protein [Clostridium botulinum]AUN01461.1 hypothetical protein RSJ19_00320 [Clostridium botulinum]MBN3352045.1 hypothetical protein [Clostridium botulinum]MBN3359187.1 hypothetical protein [Clostridium botulinum]MBN3367263.1 hypothetical protein [Clostridium botulinum]